MSSPQKVRVMPSPLGHFSYREKESLTLPNPLSGWVGMGALK